MKKRVCKDQALVLVAQYVLNNALEDYIDFCDFNEIDPTNIQGEMQSTHVYARALIGLGQVF